MEIKIGLRNVKLGVVEADALRVAPADENLSQLMDDLCKRKLREFTIETLAEGESTRTVRAMFRAWELDPSKYRPSSEALLRRVAQGKGLYRISNGVDAANLGSIETGWPFGCYDLARISGPITLRRGAAGERYEGIGKKTWHLEDRPVLADDSGPFGSPISDSTRTMVTEQAQDLLAIIYVPEPTPTAALEEATSRLAERFTRSTGAKTVNTRVAPAEAE